MSKKKTERRSLRMNEISAGINLIEDANIDSVRQQIQAIENFQAIVNQTLKKDQDFGVIPGTNKPTLLKPGAEKIIMLMGLESNYEVVEKVEDYEKGFFAYTVKSSLIKNGQLITEGFGSANTKENRYQLKEWDDELKKKIWKGKYQDPFTLANTVLKMAKKRAQVDATLTVGSLSNVFTQDMEDLKGFAQSEQVETLNETDAVNMVVTFGKHKGKTLGDIAKEDESYLDWLVKNAKQEAMKKAAYMVLYPEEKKESKPADENLITKEQEDEILNLVNVLGQAVGKTPDEVLSAYGAKELDKFARDTADQFIDTLGNAINKYMPKHDEQTQLFDDKNIGSAANNQSAKPITWGQA